ncbi:MAG TPA: hypothetical protein PLU53_14730 [Bacteroidia bacterium]|nr:hypothetical protein [Bacteroidia bacterium]
MKKGFILFFVIFSCHVAVSAPVPVLLFLSSRDQADSLGYNLVSDLPPLVYNEVMSGRIPLWDSPKKEVQIKPSTLRKLEESSGMEFSKTTQLFIYELWDLDKKDGMLQTVGFYFSNRGAGGEETSYGYVDYSLLSDVFRHSPVSTNANGNCFTSFESILSNKYYFYNIVQYGEKQIRNLKESLSLKEEVKTFVNSKITPPDFDCKLVNYVIDDTSGQADGMKKSMALLTAVQTYLNENREVFYNLGGDKIRNFMQPGKILVNKIEVRERWKKQKSEILTECEVIRIFVDGKALDSLSGADFGKFDFLVDFKSPLDFLNEKEFYFRIFRINSQEIEKNKSDAFLKGLRTWKWNVLTDFARYD